ncbi:hypothetical protein ACRAWF_09365 [Streptomyces sp. L7]
MSSASKRHVASWQGEGIPPCSGTRTRQARGHWTPRERAARLTVLARDMEVEAERLRETVARLAPQTYETLRERARRLLQPGRRRPPPPGSPRAAPGVREQVAQAEAAAPAYSKKRGNRRTRSARRWRNAPGSGFLRPAPRLTTSIGARREVKEGRTEALAALREVRQRTAAMLGEQAKEHAERWAEAERFAEERAAVAVDVRAPSGWLARRPPSPRPNRPAPRGRVVGPA